MHKMVPSRAALALCCALLSANSYALDDKDGTGNNCDNFNPYGNAYFGDTHVHTTYSVDAYTQGTETTPEQAYRFAKGEQIGLHPFDASGVPLRTAQIDRPLDFAMVSDHAEFFGEYNICTDPSHPLYNQSECQTLRQRNGFALIAWNVLLGALQNDVERFGFCGLDGSICTDEADDPWRVMIDTAEAFYDRSSDCEFTTFIGYEWTGAPTADYGLGQLETRNLHRNILFLNTLVPPKPTSYLDAPYREALWDELETECLDYVDRDFECDVITIPHNSNLSQGTMFEQTDPTGAPYDKALAQRRAQFEPLLEIFQHKGQSECLNSPMINDELCEFEIIPWGHLAGNFIAPTAPQPQGFARDALKEGLLMRDTLGANAFKYGFISSTDTHLGTAGLVEESASYPGHGGAAGGAGGVSVREGITDTPEFNPGGLAVVWATQNSRAALFDAMRRREVYGTSGPRHIVRFYGSWDLPAGICSAPNRTELAFNNGVPMGADLPAAGVGQLAPQFMVAAMMDAGTQDFPGTELQRIQIIKGWVDAGGQKHEQVYEVAGAPGNGATVDPNTCATTQGVGFDQLCTVWQDPNFDPNQEAFYYARVVENPSCRWTQRQCIAADPPVDCGDPGSVPAEYAPCCDTQIPKTVQERSWTSPIWYEVPEPPGC